MNRIFSTYNLIVYDANINQNFASAISPYVGFKDDIFLD
jgi:hypothetical protein